MCAQSNRTMPDAALAVEQYSAALDAFALLS